MAAVFLNFGIYFIKKRRIPLAWVYAIGILKITAITFLPMSLNAQAKDTVRIDKMVDSLESAWNSLLSKGKYAEIMPFLESSLSMISSQAGMESIPYARVINYRGVVHFYLQKWLESEKDYIEAMEIRKRLQGESHNSVAMGMNNLAYLYMVTGRLDESEKLYKEALLLREKVVGKQSPDYAWSLTNLGILYYNTSRYEEGEVLFKQALEIRSKNPGKQHPLYAGSLNNLASMYMIMGRYESAEPLYLESLRIKEKTSGKDSPDYFNTLENLAILYNKLGRHQEAEKIYLETKAIKEKVLRPEDPDYASVLVNLGVLYKEMDNYQRAEELLSKALALKEKIYGLTSMEIAEVLINLSSLHLKNNNITKADSFLVRAQDIIIHSVGQEHDDYADCLSLRAEILIRQKEFQLAEKCLIEAKSILASRFGKEHPNYRSLLLQLAAFYESRFRYKESESLFNESFILERKQLKIGAEFLSESELSNYVASFQKDNESLTSFAMRRVNLREDPSALVKICFDNALFHKGFLLNAANQVNTIAARDTAAQRLQLKLKSLRRRLAEQYALPARERDSLLVLDLETRANRLEKDLVSGIARISEGKKDVSWIDVQASLKHGEAAVEFMEYHVNGSDSPDSLWYVALVLKAGDPSPVAVSMCEGKSLSQLLFQGYDRRLDYVNKLYAFSGRGASMVSEKEKSLSELIWNSLSPYLKGINTIYLTPAGLLHLVNLAAIPLTETEVLADLYQVRILGSTRKLVTFDVRSIQKVTAVLYGGVVYDADSTFLAMHYPNTSQDLASRAQKQVSTTENLGHGEDWAFLKWTEKEITGIESVLDKSGCTSKIFSGASATEESFKMIDDQPDKPTVIHLATHGFFFADPGSKGTAHEQEERSFKISANPLIRSGLILAGANHAWRTGHSISSEAEDGILTAYEISQMDLSGTQLAVLSSCETGLGDIEGSEGVYGLQRAFKIAGVKYIIMSLWQVPDKQTSMLMKRERW